MRIAVGSDHAGFALKEQVRPLLEGDGHEVVDVGTDSEESTDYPRYAADAARMVSGGEADRAVLVCGSGVGVSIVANKVDGVRAVNAHDPDEAEMSRRHNDANVLALAGRRLEDGSAQEIVERFLATEFEGGRHRRRVDQIAAVERGESRRLAHLGDRPADEHLAGAAQLLGVPALDPLEAQALEPGDDQHRRGLVLALAQAGRVRTRRQAALTSRITSRTSSATTETAFRSK